MPLPPAISPADHAAAHRRRIVVWAIKLAIALGILAYLFTRLRGEDVFRAARQRAEALGASRRGASPGADGAVAQLRPLVRAGARAGARLLASATPFGWGRWDSCSTRCRRAASAATCSRRCSSPASSRASGPRRWPPCVIDRVVGLYAMLLVATGRVLRRRRGAEIDRLLQTLATRSSRRLRSSARSGSPC